MKLQRRFAPTGGEFAPESVARFIGIRMFLSFIIYMLATLRCLYQYWKARSFGPFAFIFKLGSSENL